jgi:chitodextrinase
MPVRRIVLASTVFVLASVLIGGAAAKKPAPPPPPPPPPPPSGGPSAPTNLQLTVNGPYSITLTWTAAKSGSTNWWYCIQRDGSGCIRVDPPTTTFTFSRLWPGSTFNYSVVAIESSGNRSAPSNTVTYSTPPDTTPPSAPEVSLTGVWPVRVAVAWTRSVDDTSQVWYTLLVNGVDHGANQIGFQSALVLDRAPSTTYDLQVTVRDHFGNTNQSNVVTVTTPAATETTPPTTPTNLRLSPQTSSPEIWLEWDQSTDDTDPQSQILYDVYVNGVPEHLAIGYGDELVYCHATGENRITLQAVDTSGNASGHSNEIVFIC